MTTMRSHPVFGKKLVGFQIVMALLLMSLLPTLVMPPPAPAKLGPANRIHVLAFTNSDAILIESNGHFGLVDAGEDADSPYSLPYYDSRYPLREGISSSEGWTRELDGYLRHVGVTPDNLDFVIGTHAHSDHIGGMDYIIEHYHPKYIYTPVYADEYITEESALWDNLYVYDEMIAAARRAARDHGAVLVQDFATNPASRTFTLGNATIELVNCSDDYLTDPVPDANCCSLGVKVTMDGHVAFLAGDIGNVDGDEDRHAATLRDVEFLKLGHHGAEGSNTPDYLSAIMAQGEGVRTCAVQTGYSNALSETTRDALNAMGTDIYSTSDVDGGAVVAMFGHEGMKVVVAP